VDELKNRHRDSLRKRVYFTLSQEMLKKADDGADDDDDDEVRTNVSSN
jgi:hypothetical protein